MGSSGKGIATMSLTVAASTRRGTKPLAYVGGAKWWFRGSYIFMLTGFLMTFVGVLGLTNVGITLRWVGLLACLTGALFLPGAKIQPGTVSGLVGVYAAVCFLSALTSPFSPLALAKWFALLITVTLAVVLLPRKLTVRDWQWCFDILAWLLLLMVVGCISGIADPSSYMSGRFRGGLDINPNTVGLISLLGFSVWSWRFAVDWLRRRHPVRLMISGVAVILCVPTLVLTGSRSSAAGMAAVFVPGVFALMKYRRSRALVSVSLVALALTAYLSFDLLAPQLKILVRRGTTGGMLGSRLGQWEECRQEFQRSPYLGTGYGVSLQAKGMDVGVSSIGSVVDGGGYFSLLASVGGIGTAAFLLILLYAYRQAFRLCRNPEAHLSRNVHLYQAAAVAIGLSLNLLGEPWAMGPGNPVQLVFWLAVGALSTMPAPRARRPGHATAHGASRNGP